MNRHRISTLIPALALCVALSACSTPDIKTANKNFERAWLAYITHRTDQAHDYFAEAADFYARSLEGGSEVARRPSNRVKAGMAFYFAGLYEQSLDSMKNAHRTNERIWEADLYSSLSSARLGDRDKALKHITLFLDGRPTLPMLYGAAKTQAADLESGADLDQMANLLETVMQRELIDVIRRTTSSNTIQPVTERCDGTFWWRRNKRPCSTSRDVGN